jgi:two-component system LytT family sensor kinase
MTEASIAIAAPSQRPWLRWFAHREVQFWVLQFLGWTGWAAASAIAWISWAEEPVLVGVYVVAVVLAIALSTAMRYVYRAQWTRPLPLRIVTALGLSYLMGGVWQAGKNAMVAYEMPGADDVHGFGYFHGILSSFYLMLLWSGLYFGIKYYQMLQRESQQLLRITAMAHEAQLKMLRYQLNPHFLFNTLNAISTLIIDHDAERAELMVTRLSRFLRYSLDSDPMQRVELAQELAALELYLDIEQVRFGERLKLEVDVETLAQRASIPSLLLQPIVENAIKYAIAPSERGGTIRIEAAVQGVELHIGVIDDGPGLSAAAPDATARNGVGLLNTRLRLAELYPGAFSMTLRNVTPHGLEVRLRIPFQTQ